MSKENEKKQEYVKGMPEIGEPCVLYDKICDGCGECEFCDLDPLKICDNCGKCLEMDDVASIKIDGVYHNNH